MNSNRSLFIVQSFYALFLSRSTGFVNRTLDRRLDGNSIAWLWPLAWLPNDISALSLWVLCGTLLVANFLVVIFPRFFLLRALAAISVFMLGAAANSFGQISHSDLTWVLIAVALTFLPFFEGGKRYKFMLCAQALLLATYFTSGVWKALSFAKAMFSPGFLEKLAATLPEIIAHSISGEGAVPRAVAATLGSWPLISSALWIVAILFQLSTVFWLLRPDRARLWGALIILFHATNMMILGFQFVAPMLLAFFIFFIWPEFEEKSLASG